MAEKQLKIKTGILKRNKKDLAYYRKEYDAQKGKIEKMREEGKDESDIKQQVDEDDVWGSRAGTSTTRDRSDAS